MKSAKKVAPDPHAPPHGKRTSVTHEATWKVNAAFEVETAPGPEEEVNGGQVDGESRTGGILIDDVAQEVRSIEVAAGAFSGLGPQKIVHPR